ncbi:MAG: transketolase C-terminal domain-containing protein [Gammaproteobacteria bacterium]
MPSDPHPRRPGLARQALRSINRAELLDQKVSRLLAELGSSVTPPPPRGSDRELDEAPGLRIRDAWEIFESQLRSRHLDLMARELRAKGLGYYTIGSSGHEGNAVLGRLLRLTDPVFLHYRSGALLLERARHDPEVDMLRALLLSLVASEEDPIAQGRHKVLGHPKLSAPPQTSTIASHLPKAMGAAVLLETARACGTLQNQPADGIVFVNLGDASANHSTALGAINAAAWTAYQGLPCPLLCLCEDNGWGISVETPPGWIEASYRNRLGWHYLSADGLNLFETWRVARQAIEHCRRSRAPVFFHLSVVRLLGHAGTDQEAEYRTLASIEESEARDPIIQSARLINQAGLASGRDLLDLYETVREEVRTLAEWAVGRPRLSTAEAVMAPLAPYSRYAVDAEARRLSKLPTGGHQEVSDSVPADAPLHLSLGINRVLGELLLKYPEMVVFGEDVAQKGGVYTVTSGLQRQFGPRRVFNTLLDEQSLLGLAQGGAFWGLLPVPEIQYLAYFHNAEDQIRGEAASLQFFSADQFRNGMVIRIAGLAYQKGFGGHFHNDNSIAVLRDIPGLIVACPARADDAVGLFRTLLALARVDGRVSVFLEPIALYMTKDLHTPGDRLWLAPYPDQGFVIPLGEPRFYGAPDGADLLVVTYGNGVYFSLRAAERVAAAQKARIAVMDLRWLKPLNHEAIIQACSLAKCVLVVDEGRKTGGISEEIVTLITEQCHPKPLRRLAGRDSYIPLGPAADTILLSEAEIEQALLELLKEASSPPPRPGADPARRQRR